MRSPVETCKVSHTPTVSHACEQRDKDVAQCDGCSAGHTRAEAHLTEMQHPVFQRWQGDRADRPPWWFQSILLSHAQIDDQ